MINLDEYTQVTAIWIYVGCEAKHYVNTIIFLVL